MRSVCRTVRRPSNACGTAAPLIAALSASLFAALAAALVVALFVAAPAARAQSVAQSVAQLTAQLTGYPPTAPAGANAAATADDGRLANAGELDDQTLSHQRGGALGVVMVAATPQLLRGSGVTLWDEIAPPAPLPVPIDASQAAQRNIASYTRR